MKPERKDFTEDSRFSVIGREAALIAALVIGLIAIFTLVAWLLGRGDPTQYTYLFGYPSWFAVCFLIELVFIAVFGWLLLKKFSDLSLESDDPNYDYEKEARK